MADASIDRLAVFHIVVRLRRAGRGDHLRLRRRYSASAYPVDAAVWYCRSRQLRIVPRNAAFSAHALSWIKEIPDAGTHTDSQAGFRTLRRVLRKYQMRPNAAPQVRGCGHWGGVCNRFSEEDTRLKSMFGLATDWPIEWKELEASYCEAERRIGVSGEASPMAPDRMSKPYPMPAMPMTYNLIQLKVWAEKSGIPFWTTPQAKNTVDKYNGRSVCHRCNTCEICPTGAKYTPDWTFKQLLAAKKIQLHDETLVRRLVLDEKSTRIVSATGVKENGTPEKHDDVEYRAKTFVLASGYTWSPHLLLLSANSRFPNGLANSSDHVGRYMTGHLAHETTIDLDVKIYPGMNEQHSLISRQYFRCATDNAVTCVTTFAVWESGSGRQPRLRDLGRQAAARRRGDDRLAIANDEGIGARAWLFRRASRQRQPPHARSGDEESLGRSDAARDAQDRCGHRSASGCDEAAHAGFVRAAGESERRQDGAGQLARLSGSSVRRLQDGDRSGNERRRQLRTHPRSRQPVRRRIADAADRRLHERHTDVRRAGAEVRRKDRVRAISRRARVVVSEPHASNQSTPSLTRSNFKV